MSKPRFKFHRDWLDGWRIDVLNEEAHKLALMFQKEDIGTYYTICNPNGEVIGDDPQPFYYYGNPILSE